MNPFKGHFVLKVPDAHAAPDPVDGRGASFRPGGVPRQSLVQGPIPRAFSGVSKNSGSFYGGMGRYKGCIAIMAVSINRGSLKGALGLF